MSFFLSCAIGVLWQTMQQVCKTPSPELSNVGKVRLKMSRTKIPGQSVHSQASVRGFFCVTHSSWSEFIFRCTSLQASLRDFVPTYGFPPFSSVLFSPWRTLLKTLTGTGTMCVTNDRFPAIQWHIRAFAHARPSVGGCSRRTVGGQRWAGTRELQARAVRPLCQPSNSWKILGFSSLSFAPSLLSISCRLWLSPSAPFPCTCPIPSYFSPSRPPTEVLLSRPLELQAESGSVGHLRQQAQAGWAQSVTWVLRLPHRSCARDNWHQLINAFHLTLLFPSGATFQIYTTHMEHNQLSQPRTF